MKKFLILILSFMAVCSLPVGAQKQTGKKQDIYGKLGANPNLKSGNAVSINANNTTKIEIFRDDYAADSGLEFTILIDSNQLSKYAGDRSIMGVVDSYYYNDSSYFPKAVNLINSYKLKSLSQRRSFQGRGTTKLIFYKGSTPWLELYQTSDYTNCEGNLTKLVDELVKMTGGEPQYGEPLVPDPYSDRIDYLFEFEDGIE